MLACRKSASQIASRTKAPRERTTEQPPLPTKLGGTACVLSSESHPPRKSTAQRNGKSDDVGCLLDADRRTKPKRVAKGEGDRGNEEVFCINQHHSTRGTPWSKASRARLMCIASSLGAEHCGEHFSPFDCIGLPGAKCGLLVLCPPRLWRCCRLSIISVAVGTGVPVNRLANPRSCFLLWPYVPCRRSHTYDTITSRTGSGNCGEANI